MGRLRAFLMSHRICHQSYGYGYVATDCLTVIETTLNYTAQTHHRAPALALAASHEPPYP